jgi:hypothetical protein
MSQPLESIAHRVTALALAAVVTLGVLGSIDGLARRGMAGDSLLAQQQRPVASQPAQI